MLRAIEALVRFIRLKKQGNSSISQNKDDTSLVPMQKYLSSTLTGFNYALLQAARIAQIEAFGGIIDLITCQAGDRRRGRKHVDGVGEADPGEDGSREEHLGR